MIVKLAGCVLLDKAGRIGLLHRHKAEVVQWELPGGKIEPNETEREAAQRELLEELGIQVTISKQLGNVTFTDSYATKYDYTWFLAHIKSGAPHVCESTTFDDFQFYELRGLERLKLSANMQLFEEQLKTGTLKL